MVGLIQVLSVWYCHISIAYTSFCIFVTVNENFPPPLSAQFFEVSLQNRNTFPRKDWLLLLPRRFSPVCGTVLPHRVPISTLLKDLTREWEPTVETWHACGQTCMPPIRASWRCLRSLKWMIGSTLPWRMGRKNADLWYAVLERFVGSVWRKLTLVGLQCVCPRNNDGCWYLWWFSKSDSGCRIYSQGLLYSKSPVQWITHLDLCINGSDVCSCWRFYGCP